MSRDLTEMTPIHESNKGIISSISQIIVPLTSSISSAISSTPNNISHVVTSAFVSHNHEIDFFPKFHVSDRADATISLIPNQYG